MKVDLKILPKTLVKTSGAVRYVVHLHTWDRKFKCHMCDKATR